MKKILAAAVFALLSIPTQAPCAVPAFPGAEGYGAVSTGGRGGRVIEVTNLNDAGAGSLRAACEATGARIVVFRVGGTISLSSALRINNPFITIAGQTAPGGGIQLRATNTGDKVVRIQTNNVIMRYMRVRHGYVPLVPDATTSCVFIYERSYNVILDHMSVAWATDENFTAYASSDSIRNLTFSWCISGEGLRPVDVSQDHHGAGIICGSNANPDACINYSIHHNFFVHNQFRNPYIKIHNAEVVNNISYNWEFFAMMFCGGMKIDIIGNIFTEGPFSGKCSWTSPIPIIWRSDLVQPETDGGPAGDPSVFIQGNIGYGVTNPTSDNWILIDDAPLHKSTGKPPSASFRRTTIQSDVPYKVTIHNANALPDTLLATVGACRRLDENGNWIMNRDAVDTRYIAEYRAGTGTLPATEDAVGGFPVLAAGTPYADADRDGMADVWELKCGLDPADATDGNKDLDSDGFTNIEEFLAGLPARGAGTNTTPDALRPGARQRSDAGGMMRRYSLRGEALDKSSSSNIGDHLVIAIPADGVARVRVGW